LAGRAAYPCIGQETRKVSRDAYVSFRGNRYSVPWYSVPWCVAGQEVLLQEDGAQLQITRGGECLAVHPLCSPGARQSITVAAHHAGIPLGLVGPTGKAKILLADEALAVASLPVVEVRPLWAYEQYEPQYEPGGYEPGYAAPAAPSVLLPELEVQHG
jgi:hypothetical protein